jgi:hypothetical protein
MEANEMAKKEKSKKYLEVKVAKKVESDAYEATKVQ